VVVLGDLPGQRGRLGQPGPDGSPVRELHRPVGDGPVLVHAAASAGPASAYYWPGTRPAVFDLSVTAHDSTLASARLTRRWLVAPPAAGAHTVAASGFDGQFFPSRDVPAGNGVLPY
jgi:hypothetical protein